MYEAASTRDVNIGPITAAQWVGFVQRPQNHGGKDFRVILQDDRLVGLAESSLRDQNRQGLRMKFSRDCKSAGGPDADTHDNALLFLTLAGSFLYA